MRTLALVLLLVLAAPRAHANEAEEQVGTWTGFNSTIRVWDKWSVFAQGELRTWELYRNLNETLGRVAGHFQLTRSTMVGLGYVRADTFGFDSDFGTRKRGENRIYQQFAATHSWGRTTLEHRFRLEQRFFREGGESSYGNRFRYMLGATVPLGSRTLRPGSYYLNAFDELFLNFGTDSFSTFPELDKEFDQNRLFLGVGRQLTDHSRIQGGLLWQARPDESFLRIVISYVHNFDARNCRRLGCRRRR